MELFLHDKQLIVHTSRARFRVVVAGRRWGKTALSRTEMVTRAASKPKQKIWYVAPTFNMARQIMWDDLLEAIPSSWIKKKNESRLSVKLRNGSVIELKGADRPDTLRGIGLHFAVLDEYQDMKDEVWEKCVRPTLSSTGGKALIIGTPKAFNCLYDAYARGQMADMVTRGLWESWQFPTSSSPFVPDHEIETAREELDVKTFRQEYEASFESMSGRVYYPFDRSKHVGDYPFDPTLPIWVGQDFNIDPMSSCILQPQPNGEIWAVDEIVLPSSNTEEVCQELERKYWRQQSSVVIYPDPAGAQRQHARGESDLSIMRDHGFKKLSYHRKHPAIADRVNAVNRMLESADGTVRLRVDKRCKHLISSLDQTIYKAGTRDIDKAAGVEHITDAMGYCIEREFPVHKVHVTGLSI